MSEIREYLQKIDDDYLIGLSNKGIVKRAHKDREQASFEMKEEENVLNVTVDECSCKLVLPLGESKCSCPSRSICKHIVMAVLYAKEQHRSGGDSFMVDSRVEEAVGKSAATGNKTITDDKSTITDESRVKNDSGNPVLECEKLTVDNNGTAKNTDDTREQKKEFPQIAAYPLETIKKKLTTSAMKKIWERMQFEKEPEITISSIITVHFPEEGMMVKLLEPIEYSTCSCHKKELCMHKAQAILYYQLNRGMIEKNQIYEMVAGEEQKTYDLDAIGRLADTMLDMLGELIFTGLSRTSSEMVLSCERMAVMCHNLLLPDYEKRFRSLSEYLDLYFKRHASFEVRRFMLEVTESYRKAKELKLEAENGDVSVLAGKNRSEYVLTKPLSLMGMGQRHFRSKTGYEGETTYFLEENTGEWYTYTNARPVFYENEKNRRPVGGYEGAPWNLNCTMEEFAGIRIRLEHGRVNEENRLSATKEAFADITGSRMLSKDVVQKHIYDDFKKLFEKKFSDWQNQSDMLETDKLAIVKAAAIEEANFDAITQEFSMKLLDREGRALTVKVAYSKAENYTIRYLERLSRRVENGCKKPPLFFGIVYLDEGRMKMYPIEDYEVS